MKRVKSAEANDDYTLDVEFDDGAVRRLDAKPYLDKGIFVALKDINRFKKVKVAYGTVNWEGELDLAPETLYIESKVIG